MPVSPRSSSKLRFEACCRLSPSALRLLSRTPSPSMSHCRCPEPPTVLDPVEEADGPPGPTDMCLENQSARPGLPAPGCGASPGGPALAPGGPMAIGLPRSLEPPRGGGVSFTPAPRAAAPPVPPRAGEDSGDGAESTRSTAFRTPSRSPAPPRPSTPAPRVLLRFPRLLSSHGCFRSFAAVGRLLGSFWKHFARKSAMELESPWGSGGWSSCTMRYSADIGCRS